MQTSSFKEKLAAFLGPDAKKRFLLALTLGPAAGIVDKWIKKHILKQSHTAEA